MEKENLILVPGFGNTRKMLEPFLEYLSEFFSVNYLDLPGYSRDIAPLEKISVDNYARFVEKGIDELALRDYIVGGISFAYPIMCRANLGRGCKGILAIEPYTNSRSLLYRKEQRAGLSVLMGLVCGLKLSNYIWKTPAFKKTLRERLPEKVTEMTLEEMDPRTYFEIARYMLKNNAEEFKAIPHVLYINRHDEIVDSSYLKAVFQKNVKDLMIIEADLEHFPENMNKDYFKSMIPDREVKGMMEFFSRKKK